MEEQQIEIHLALAFDKNFINPFYVLLTSIFDNNKKNKIIIHVIATGVSDAEKNKIIKYIEHNEAEIYFYDIEKNKILNDLDKSYLNSDRYTIAIFYRLFFPLLIPKNIEKLLYMDVEIVILDNLKNLYCTDISPFPIGAAKDNTFGIADDHILLNKIGVEMDNYFNSGVLLIDLDQWKKQNITDRALKFIVNNLDIIKFPDQDALNHVLKNNWYKLDKEYNFCHSEIPIELTKKEILKNIKITVLHYTSSKPWHFTNSARLRSIYYYYLKRSPYLYKKKYNDFSWTKNSFRGFIYIRILEFYLDHPWIKNMWKKIK